MILLLEQLSGSGPSKYFVEWQELLHDSEKVSTLMGEYLKPGSGQLN